MSAETFYVYVYFRPDGSPCYVGKGRGKRWRAHLTQCRNAKLAAIIESANRELPIIKVRENLTAHQAREIEEALIRAIGREPNGPLVNLTDGGDGPRGRIMPAEERARRSQILRSPEVNARMVASHLGKPSAKKGIPMSEAAREKMRKAHLGEKQTQERIEKRRIGQLRYWANQENRDRQRRIQINRYTDPAERRRTGIAVSAGIRRKKTEDCHGEP